MRYALPTANPELFGRYVPQPANRGRSSRSEDTAALSPTAAVVPSPAGGRARLVTFRYDRTDPTFGPRVVPRVICIEASLASMRSVDGSYVSPNRKRPERRADIKTIRMRFALRAPRLAVSTSMQP